MKGPKEAVLYIPRSLPIVTISGYYIIEYDANI